MNLKDGAPFDALVDMTEKAMVTGDFDPVYPMLTWVTEQWDLDDALWFAWLYVAHYNLASGLQAFKANPKPVPKLKGRYPIRFQRRNLRTSYAEMDQHIEETYEHIQRYGGIADWLQEGFDIDEHENGELLADTVMSVYGNGRWAGIKMIEVFEACGLRCHPGHMFHRHSAAPRKGLGLFIDDPGGNDKETIAYLDQQSEELTKLVRDQLSEEVFHFGEYDYPFGVAEMESNLCDFKSMNKGAFYSGKCADVVLGCMHGQEGINELWEARSALFDHRVLGEYGGWAGVDPSRDKLYSSERRIPWRWEEC